MADSLPTTYALRKNDTVSHAALALLEGLNRQPGGHAAITPSRTAKAMADLAATNNLHRFRITQRINSNTDEQQFIIQELGSNGAPVGRAQVGKWLPLGKDARSGKDGKPVYDCVFEEYRHANGKPVQPGENLRMPQGYKGFAAPSAIVLRERANCIIPPAPVPPAPEQEPAAVAPAPEVTGVPNNNTAECNANITVQDITDPNAICHNISVNLSSVNPGTVTIFANNGNPAVSVDFGSTDNCSIVTYEIAVDGGTFGSSYTFDCSDDGIHTVVLRVTDQSGNDATCQASVTVNDVTFPTITCPANVVIGTSLGGSGDCSGTYTWRNPIPTDNCSIVSYTVTANNSTVSVVGNTLISRTFTKSGSPHTVVYTVTDENNNVTTCSFTK